MANYTSVSEEDGKNFYLAYRGKGSFKMLNLLRFKEVADYSSSPDLYQGEPISGEEAYNAYIELTLPFLEDAGSKLLMEGICGNFAIGPAEEQWDYMLIVEHESVEKFLAFAVNEQYLKIAGHRTAAIIDSRLLPFQ